MNLSNLVALIVRLLIVYVFLRAALPKIQDPVSFAVAVGGFRLTGPELSMWVALALPWLELISGLGLLMPKLRRASGLILALLLLVFIGLHSSAWIRGSTLAVAASAKNSAANPPTIGGSSYATASC